MDPVAATAGLPSSTAAALRAALAQLDGSAFAHLTEEVVAGYSYLHTDGDIVIDAGGTYAGIGLAYQPFLAALLDQAGYDAWTPTFEVRHDGSMHWGDGVGAPDTHLKRGAAGVLVLAGAASELDFYDTGHIDVYLPTGTATTVGSAYAVQENDDAASRFRFNGNGKMEWGDGTVQPDVRFGRAPGGPQLVVQAPDGTGPSIWFDISDPQGGSFYVYSANGQAGFNGAGGFATTLDAALEVEAFVAQMAGNIDWGFNLYNDGTNWKMGFGTGAAAKDVFIGRSAADVFAIGKALEPDALEMYELAGDAAAPAVNGVRWYAKDVGGKTALFARFATGAPQQVAIQP